MCSPVEFFDRRAAAGSHQKISIYPSRLSAVLCCAMAADGLEALSVSQLRVLLSGKGISCTGCVEKARSEAPRADAQLSVCPVACRET